MPIKPSELDIQQMIFEGWESFDEAAEDAAERAIPPEEARLISETARGAFQRKGESGEVPAWFGDYLQLREMGWPWRVATYIAWAASVKTNRWPKTLNELATDVLGLRSPRAVHTWREKYPTIGATISIMQAMPLMEYRRDLFEATIRAGLGDYKGNRDRRLALEMTQDYIPHLKIEERQLGKITDLSGVSREDLEKIGGGKLREALVRLQVEGGSDENGG
jgi:hypothetical protein